MFPLSIHASSLFPATNWVSQKSKQERWKNVRSERETQRLRLNLRYFESKVCIYAYISFSTGPGDLMVPGLRVRCVWCVMFPTQSFSRKILFSLGGGLK